jgi:hypothetical protein
MDMIDDDALLAQYREHATEHPRPQVDQAILEAASCHRARPAVRYFRMGLAASLATAAVTAWWLGSGHGPAMTAPVDSAGIAEGRSGDLDRQTAPDAAGMNEGRTVDALTRAM